MVGERKDRTGTKDNSRRTTLRIPPLQNFTSLQLADRVSPVGVSTDTA